MRIDELSAKVKAIKGSLPRPVTRIKMSSDTLNSVKQIATPFGGVSPARPQGSIEIVIDESLLYGEVKKVEA